MFTVHAFNQFLGHEFFTWLEIASFAYVYYFAMQFAISRHPANNVQAIAKDEPDPTPKEVIMPQPPTLEIPEEVIVQDIDGELIISPDVTVKELRDQIKREGLVSFALAYMGKSYTKLRKDELLEVLANV